MEILPTINNISNLSQSEIVRILEAENDKEVERLIPLIVFLGVICVIGIIGNGLVCYIYYERCNSSSSRWFIFFLAVVDMVFCLTVIPIEIFTTFQQFNFKNNLWCKFTAFLNLWAILSLGLILVVVAIDRYQKVCKPHGWQMNNFKSKIMSAVVVALSFIIALPSIFVYKIHKVEIRTTNYIIIGSECSFKKDDGEMSLKVYFIGFGMLLFICSLLTICILYCFIGVAIKKHLNKERTRSHCFSPNTKTSTNHSSSVEADDTTGQTAIIPDDMSTETAFMKNSVGMKMSTMDRNRNRKSVHVRSRAKKATLIMFFISLAFVICYLPFLTLILMRNIIVNFHENLSDELRAVYKFLLRSFFMCCAVNPFIYGFSDSKFRRSVNDVTHALGRLICCCCGRQEGMNVMR